MAIKSKTTVASKRTKVKNLPKAVKKVTAKDMKKVRGGDDLTQKEPESTNIPKAVFTAHRDR